MIMGVNLIENKDSFFLKIAKCSPRDKTSRLLSSSQHHHHRHHHRHHMRVTLYSPIEDD
jgi:hypothetical protein